MNQHLWQRPLCVRVRVCMCVEGGRSSPFRPQVRSERNRWAKYWVVLRENCIYYFNSEKDKQPHGMKVSIYLCLSSLSLSQRGAFRC